MKPNANIKPLLAPHPHLKNYYREEEQRRHFVSWLFDETASEYDWIIRAMSFGSGNWYRKQALVRAGLTKGMHVLDVATGTGPIAKSETELVGPLGTVTGLDRSINMLRETRKQVSIPLVHAGADQLPFKDSTYDFLSMGYALRHVDDLHATFTEYFRVLKPGGTMLILELTRPHSLTGRAFTRFYLHKVVPLIARIGSGTKDAETLMKYFWDTIEHCVEPKAITGMLSNCGFKNVHRHCIAGIFSEYTAVKPA